MITLPPFTAIRSAARLSIPIEARPAAADAAITHHNLSAVSCACVGSTRLPVLAGSEQAITSPTQHQPRSLVPNFDNLCRPSPDRLLRRGALRSTLLPHFVSHPPRHDRPCRQLVDGLGSLRFRITAATSTVHQAFVYSRSCAAPAALRTVPQAPPLPTITEYPSSWYSFVSTSGDQPSGSPASTQSASPQSPTLRTPCKAINGKLSQLAPQGSRRVSSV